MTLLRTFKLSYRLFLLIAIFALGFVIYGSWSFRTLDQLKVNGPLYQEIIGAKDLIADAVPPPLNIMESWTLCLEMATPGTEARRIGALEVRLGMLRDQHAARLRYWRAQRLDADLARLVDATEQPARRFYALAFDSLLPALGRGTRRGDGNPGPHGGRIRTAPASHRRAGRAPPSWPRSPKRRPPRVDDDTTRLRLILLASLAIGLGAAVLIRRSITGPLDEALGLARRVAAA
ncbi:hypothetical protein LP419_35080 [Massilia sp. H-1]|nr:hypothetical protein LP419_35080 [Massilia sp. H-1]